jgi:hypothetical protein
MAAGMKKLALIPILVALVYGGLRIHSHHHATKPLAQDRIWIDHMPRGERDTINVFVLFSEQPVGAFQATSMWKGQFEAFRFEQSGDEIRAVYPQTGDKEKLRVSARACSEKGMDYCLELDGGTRGVKKYYSREEWVIDRQAQLEPDLQKLFR